MTEAIKIYHIAEAAGIKSSPHSGLNSAYGQQFCYAMPDCTLSEFHLSTPVGVPLEEVAAMPGVPVPKDGYLVPSAAPGFGLEITEDCIRPWDHTQATTGGGDVVL